MATPRRSVPKIIESRPLQCLLCSGSVGEGFQAATAVALQIGNDGNNTGDDKLVVFSGDSSCAAGQAIIIRAMQD